MSSVSTYLNFTGKTEEAFNFYKSVFGTEYSSPFSYMRDIPGYDCPEEEKNLVMNVQLPILAGHILMGTDVPPRMQKERGFVIGDNVTINLQPDTRKETEELFAKLSEGGSRIEPLQEMFWGDYYGFCVDKFGIRWMFNCTEKKQS